MTTFVYGLMLVGVSATLAEWLTLGGEGSAMKGHLRLVIGLCVLVACIYPLGEGITYLKNLALGDLQVNLPSQNQNHEDYQHMFDQYLSDTGGQEIKDWVEDTMSQVFGIDKDLCEVLVEMDTSQGIPQVTEVYITLRGKAVFKNPHQIEAYIASHLSCVCHVLVES